MTTYRFDRLRAADVELAFVSTINPDTIGIEFTYDGNGLFELTMTRDGSTSILFDEIENAEFPLSDFRDLMERGMNELKSWHERVSQPGENWPHS